MMSIKMLVKLKSYMNYVNQFQQVISSRERQKKYIVFLIIKIN